MKEFTLPKNGDAARIVVLDGSDLSDVLALHEATRTALPADKKRFLLPRSMAYFQNLLTGITGQMIGVRVEQKLIGQMALLGPMPLREAIALQAITHNDVSYHHASLTDSVIVFKSLASHPEWRGNNLAKNLIGYGLEMPLAQVAGHVFAHIAASNLRSWSAFSQQKFGIVAAGYDPEDGVPHLVLQNPAFGFDFAPAIIADEADPVEDFSAILALTQREALIGVRDENSSGKLAFMRSREASNLMPTLARVQANVR